MKKHPNKMIRSVFALALSMAMIFSLFSMPVFADDGEQGQIEPPECICTEGNPDDACEVCDETHEHCGFTAQNEENEEDETDDDQADEDDEDNNEEENNDDGTGSAEPVVITSFDALDTGVAMQQIENATWPLNPNLPTTLKANGGTVDVAVSDWMIETFDEIGNLVPVGENTELAQGDAFMYTPVLVLAEGDSIADGVELPTIGVLVASIAVDVKTSNGSLENVDYGLYIGTDGKVYKYAQDGTHSVELQDVILNGFNYIPAAGGGTLELDGFSYTTNQDVPILLSVPNNTTIKLSKTNTFTSSGVIEAGNSYGILARGASDTDASRGTLTIIESGVSDPHKLIVKPAEVEAPDDWDTSDTYAYQSHAIHAKDINIKSGEVEATGGDMYREQWYGATNTAATLYSETNKLSSVGIYADAGVLTIDGTAKVTATGGDVILGVSGSYTDGIAQYYYYGRAYAYSYGIFAHSRGMIIDGAAEVLALGGVVSGKSSINESYGIFSDGYTVSGGTGVTGITISSTGEVDAIGAEAGGVTSGSLDDSNGRSFGIYAEGFINVDGGDVWADSAWDYLGDADASAQTDSYGMYSKFNDITITDSDVETYASGGGSSHSAGIYSAAANVTIDGASDVGAYGGSSSGTMSYGIYAFKNVTIEDESIVAAASEDADGGSFGIYAEDDITITTTESTDGVYAESAAADGMGSVSAGIMAFGGTLTIDGALVEAIGNVNDDSNVYAIGLGGNAVDIKGNSDVTAESYDGDFSEAISAATTVTITDSEVNITVGDATGEGTGIYAMDGITITRSNVLAEVGDSSDSCGFYVDTGDITINNINGTTAYTVEAMADTTTSGYGMSADRIIINTGVGTVEAEGADGAFDPSVGNTALIINNPYLYRYDVATSGALSNNWTIGDKTSANAPSVFDGKEHAKIEGQGYTLKYDGNTNTGGTKPADQLGIGNVNIVVAGKSTLVKTGYTFTGWNTKADGTGTNYAVGSNYKFTAQVIAGQSATLYAVWTPDYAYNPGNSGGGSSSGGGGGSSTGGGGGGAAPTIYTMWLEKNPAKVITADAEKKNLEAAHTKSNLMYGVRKESFAVMNSLIYMHDTMLNNTVLVRVTITEPKKITKDTLVSGWLTGLEADKVRAKFTQWFSNKIRVIHLDQQEDWGTFARIAAKVDLSGMDTGNLYFYSYNKKNNTYVQITAPDYRIDKNGYLHFTTPYAREIIVSEKPLAKK